MEMASQHKLKAKLLHSNIVYNALVTGWPKRSDLIVWSYCLESQSPLCPSVSINKKKLYFNSSFHPRIPTNFAKRNELSLSCGKWLLLPFCRWGRTETEDLILQPLALYVITDTSAKWAHTDFAQVYMDTPGVRWWRLSPREGKARILGGSALTMEERLSRDLSSHSGTVLQKWPGFTGEFELKNPAIGVIVGTSGCWALLKNLAQIVDAES